MEVLRGPTAFGIEPAYVREAAVQDSRAAVASRMFDDGADEIIASGSRIDADRDEVSSASSSSIGTPSDEDDEEEEDEVESSVNSDEAESKFRGGGSLSIATLNSLEDALPIKRGLSSHFSGKSKSFASLADVVTVNDLKKSENPLNKRRRLLIASKWAKKSFYSFANPKSMSLLALQENDDDFDDHDVDDDQNDNHDDDDDEEEQAQRKEQEHHDRHGQRSFSKFHEKRFKSFKARCFSLADLQEHSVLEDDEMKHK